MLRQFTVGLLFVGGCIAGKVEQQRLADGTFALTCRLPMDACVREIEKTCRDKRYRILEGASEIKLRDASPHETEYPTSRIGFVCTSEAPMALVDVSTRKASPPPGLPARVCGLGDTRACVGPGACSGGQACRPDGTGFGPCECAPSAGADASATSSVLPATADAGSTDSGR